MEALLSEAKMIFPLKKAPLVHCITNEITSELVANGLLFIGAKPIMAEDVREFPALFEKTDSLFLNLGRITPQKEQTLICASATADGKPVVLDIVGAAATPLRLQLAHSLANDQPSVLKGNISELRAFCGLPTQSRGVDGSQADQNAAELSELAAALCCQDPAITYLATGEKDLIVQKNQVWIMTNGVPELDRFTGSGDLVGALIAALLGAGHQPLVATFAALSYLNRCGELAHDKLQPLIGMADFRHETLNQLSLLAHDPQWTQHVKGRKK